MPSRLPTGHSRFPSPERQRILHSACLGFSEHGFEGTHLRDLCQSAGVDESQLHYYFDTKEELYAAVLNDAARHLACPAATGGNCPTSALPRERFRTVVQSLFERMAGERVWIAQLLARELVEKSGKMPGVVGVVFERHLILLQNIVRELMGPDADDETVLFHALSVLGHCVFFCLASANFERLYPKLARQLPPQAILSRHIIGILLNGIERRPRMPENGFRHALSRRKGLW